MEPAAATASRPATTRPEATPRRRAYRWSLPEAQAARLVARYLEGATIVDLAGEFELSRDRVGTLLQQRQVPRRRGPLTVAAATTRATQIIEQYQGGDTLAQVAQAVGLSPSQVSKILADHDTPRRPRYRSRTPAEEKQIIADYQDGASMAALARKHSMSPATIGRILDAHQVPRRPRRTTRTDHPSPDSQGPPTPT